MSNPRVLIASPIRQKPAVLRHFLESLTRLSSRGVELSCAFIDDNTDPESTALLAEYRFPGEYAVIRATSSSEEESDYLQDDIRHHWNDRLIWKVARFKDFLIDLALERNFDYVFLVDSDLVLSPFTIEHLVSCDRDIVSEVFWTSWRPGHMLLPQVWLTGTYEFVPQRRDEPLTELEKKRRSIEFIKKLYSPGLYRVGGLGACTLISRRALEKGVRFAEIDNLTYWGEDRHFCVRARALGIELWADTSFPPLHLYRDDLLSQVQRYISWSSRNRWLEPHITLSMTVRNESGRYLERALRQHRAIIDAAVIIDDASSDDTVSLVRRCLAGIPLKIIENKKCQFNNEVDLRKKQWDETVITGPDWILNLDADEILDEKSCAQIRSYASQKRNQYIGFRLFDMWDEQHYREDDIWSAHKRHKGFMFRYTPFFDYMWKDALQHCGRFPKNLSYFDLLACDIGVRHMGWSREADRIEKYNRYRRLDPDGKYGSVAQYQSILDPKPTLRPWL